jgi:glutathione S-transferase
MGTRSRQAVQPPEWLPGEAARPYRSAMLTLFHAPKSRSSRFVWLLEELGEPYAIEYVTLRGRAGPDPDPRNPHPHGKAPALVHDGRLVTESSAICLYLTDAFPQAGLGPQVGDEGRADYVTWLAFYAGVIEPSLLAKVTSWTTDPAMTGWVSFDVVEARIAEAVDKKPWMLGDQFSTVDVLIGSLLQWAGRMFPERPQYERYRAAIAARPAAQRALAKDEPPQ